MVRRARGYRRPPAATEFAQGGSFVHLRLGGSRERPEVGHLNVKGPVRTLGQPLRVTGSRAWSASARGRKLQVLQRIDQTEDMSLLPHEALDFGRTPGPTGFDLTDESINEKYSRGDIRIVTEQARYPLSTIRSMVDSDDYNLNPEFQRRHRWLPDKQSRLIESIIMNVPIPPIFLYEDQYSHYEVMDGLQRLTAIAAFYRDSLTLEGLEEWPELNGRKYSTLPDQIRRGVDRRYLSSIILLHETARDSTEAQQLKQLVFERINSGGVQLEPQESRNALYDGPLNQLCIRLARDSALCAMWGIPHPANDPLVTEGRVLENERYRKMDDVELVLRFFAHRQRSDLQRGSLKAYLDNYLKSGNLFPEPTLELFSQLFTATTALVYAVLGRGAFWLWRYRYGTWGWFERPTTVAYDALMRGFSLHLADDVALIAKSDKVREKLRMLYEDHADDFEGRYTNLTNVRQRDVLIEGLIQDVLQA